MKVPLATAIELAEQMKALLAPVVERIAIVGSVRRRKAVVGDVELLFIPKIESRAAGLFDSEPFDLASEFIDKLVADGTLGKRLKDGTNFVAGWGAKNKLAFHRESGISLDLFSTTAENWWVSLVIRTGGKDTNLLLTTGAQKLGYTLNAYGAGVTTRDGTVIPATSEEHVFRLCALPYKLPHERI